MQIAITSEIKKFVKRLVTRIKADDGLLEFWAGNNNYPETTEYIKDNSITVWSATDMMKRFIVGKGYAPFNDIKVNKNQTFIEWLQDLAESVALHRGASIYADFNRAGRTTETKILPFFSIRKNKKDDTGYNALFTFNMNFEQTDKNQVLWNWDTNTEVMINRIDYALQKKRGSKPKGMLYYYNADEGKNEYPISRLHPVLKDSDTEMLVSTYKNKIVNGGFFGKKIFLMPKLVDDTVDKTTPYYKQRAKAQLEIENNLQKFMGVENIDSVMILSVGVDDLENLDKFLTVKDIKSDIEPDLFEKLEKSLSINIRSAFNNIPEILIKNADNSMFGNSGEMLKQAKLFYQEQTQNERDIIEAIVKKIFAKFDNKTIRENLANFEIEKLVTDDKTTATDTE